MRAVIALTLLAVATTVSAHICMWTPLQRGPFDISTPGSDSCYRKPGPCGGVPYTPNGVVTTLHAGQQFVVNFQQNYNHYYVGNPGYLEVSYAQGTNPSEGDFTPLGMTINDWNAMDMITQTNFSVTITVPATTCKQCVLRARYLSNNPLENDRGEVFHQCADITIVSPQQQPHQHHQPSSSAAAVQQHARLLPGAHRIAPELQQNVGPCCVGNPQWSVGWSETGSYRQATMGATWYDAINKLLRVDTVSGAGTGTGVYDGSFTHYNNFTSGIEYYLNHVTGVCEPAGLDYWNDWCYGTANQTETFVEQIVIGETTTNVYQNGEFYFGGTNDQTCQPVVLARPSKGMTTVYFNYEVGAADPSIFQPPPQCHLALEEALASGKPLKRSDSHHNRQRYVGFI